MSSRSSRRRAARERWSRSTLGALLLDRLVLIMAPSTARLPPAEAGGRPNNSSPIPRRCVSRFTLPAIYFAGVQVVPPSPPDVTTCRGARHQRGRGDRHDLASHAPIEQVTDRGEPLPHAGRDSASILD